MLNSQLCVLIVLAVSLTLCSSIEVVSSGLYAVGAVVVSVGLAGYNKLNCYTNECCTKDWVKLNYPGLMEDLKRHLYGQHFVEMIVPQVLKSHLNNENPKKALVMSFHGWTGSGKNHVAQIIVKNLLKQGTESKFYHLYIGSRSFSHLQDLNQYKEKLRKDIEESTKLCDRSIFVFDEVDKMVPGLLDALTPYIDFHDHVENVNYRKNIFIFLSNAGGNNITRVALKFWADGKNREDITLKDVEPLISRGAFNEVGGFYRSEMVKKDLINVYVPFLPLEKRHVRKCVRSELESRGEKEPDEELIEFIADQLIYLPKESEVFSASGCKKISQKVDLYGD